MTRPQQEEEFPGLDPAIRGRHLRPGMFLVKRDGLILIETDSKREARILAFKRGDGAVATDYRGVLIMGRDG